MRAIGLPNMKLYIDVVCITRGGILEVQARELIMCVHCTDLAVQFSVVLKSTLCILKKTLTVVFAQFIRVDVFVKFWANLYSRSDKKLNSYLLVKLHFLFTYDCHNVK